MRVRILVVDDELLLRDVLYDFLTKKGYTVYSVSDGFKAVETIKEKNKVDSEERIQLALIDIKMPGMSGLELTTELKKLDPNLGIIVMTGYPSIDTALTALKNGALEYIVKPFRLDELKRIIDKNLMNLGTEYENIILKERIKQLEQKVSESEDKKKSKNEIDSEISLLGDLISKPRFKDSEEKSPRADFYKVINAYKEKSTDEAKKVQQEKIQKLDEFLEKGLIDRKEYESKKKEISADKGHE